MCLAWMPSNNKIQYQLNCLKHMHDKDFLGYVVASSSHLSLYKCLWRPWMPSKQSPKTIVILPCWGSSPFLIFSFFVLPLVLLLFRSFLLSHLTLQHLLFLFFFYFLWGELSLPIFSFIFFLLPLALLFLSFLYGILGQVLQNKFFTKVKCLG